MLQHLLLTLPGGVATFPLRAAWLGDQRRVIAPLAEPMIILQERLPVGLMKLVEIHHKAERVMPVLFDQFILLDQEFPLPDIVAERVLSWVLCHIGSPLE